MQHQGPFSRADRLPESDLEFAIVAFIADAPAFLDVAPPRDGEHNRLYGRLDSPLCARANAAGAVLDGGKRGVLAVGSLPRSS